MIDNYAKLWDCDVTEYQGRSEYSLTAFMKREAAERNKTFEVVLNRYLIRSEEPDPLEVSKLI